MKKRKQSKDKHYFARTCRSLGRFVMCAGAILALGLIILGILRATQPTLNSQLNESFRTINNSTATDLPTITVNRSSHGFNLGAAMLAIAISIGIVLFFAQALKSYNSAIRKTIAKCAEYARMPIFLVELTLTLIFWMITLLFMFQDLPIFSLYIFITLIINELLFIFAWLSYGRPAYTL